MLDGLGGRDQGGVGGRRTLVLGQVAVTLLEDAVNGVAPLAARRPVDHGEDVLEPLHLAFGLGAVLREGRLEFVGGCRLLKLRQRLEDVTLGVVHVAEGVVEQTLQVLFSHDRLLWVVR